MRRTFAVFAVASLTLRVGAQVAINEDGADPHPSAMLEVTSNGSGVLIPRLTLAQRDAIANPVTGLLIFCNTDQRFHFFGGAGWSVVGVPDGDTDPGNELQSLSRTGTTVTLSHGGGSVDVADADSSPAIELQNLSRDGDLIRLTNGASASLLDGDNDPANELQTVSRNGNTLTLSNGGGSANLDDGDSDPTNELDSKWSRSGNKVFYTTGAVGIGTQSPNPGVKLDIGTFGMRGGNPASGKALTATGTLGGALWDWAGPQTLAVFIPDEKSYRIEPPQSIEIERNDRILVMFSCLASLKGVGSGSDDLSIQIKIFPSSIVGSEDFDVTGEIGNIDQHRAYWVPVSFARVVTTAEAGTATIGVQVNVNGDDDIYLKDSELTVINLGP